MANRLARLVAAWKGNGNGAPPEGKEYPATGIRFVGGSGPFTNRSIHWLGNGSAPNAEALDRATAFVTSAYCYTAMMWRMKRVAEAPLMVVLETEEGEEWQPDHDLAELFDSPRDDLRLGEIISRTVGYQDLTGSALWVLDRDRLGRRRQITPFSGAQVKTEAADGLIYGKYSVLDAKGNWKVVAREDVIHFRDTDPFSWRSCTSKVDAAMLQLNLSHTVQRITTAFLLKAMFPGGILSPDKDWHPTAEEWEEWKATIDAWHGGPANAGTPLALQGGTLFSRTSGAMADLLPAPILDRVEATVGSVFGIPPVVLGWLTGLQNSPWSQMSEARRQTYEDTIEPIWTEYAEIIGRALLTPEERKRGLLVRFDTSRIRALQEDRELNSRISQNNADIWMIDERRLLTGQSPLPEDDPRGSMIVGLADPMPSEDLGRGDDDPDPAADAAAEGTDVQATALNGAQVTALLDIVSQVTAGAIPVSAAVAMVAAAFPLLTPEQVEAIFADVEEGSAVEDEPPPADGASGGKSADTKDLLWLLFDLSTKASEPKWARTIGAHLDQLKAKIVAGLRENVKTENGQLSSLPALAELKALPDEQKATRLPEWLKRILDEDTPRLAAKAYPLLISTGGAGVRRLAARLKLSFSVLEPGLITYAKRESKFLAEVMGKTTGQAVAKAVQAGLDAGDTVAGLAKRLQELPAFDRTRAKMTARTETTRAWNGAQRTSMSHYRRTARKQVFKFWLSARDARVRDEHAALDDETSDKGIPVDEAFSNGLTEPGEPNCRCSLTYEVGDDDLEIDEPSEVTE